MKMVEITMHARQFTERTVGGCLLCYWKYSDICYVKKLIDIYKETNILNRSSLENLSSNPMIYSYVKFNVHYDMRVVSDQQAVSL